MPRLLFLKITKVLKKFVRENNMILMLNSEHTYLRVCLEYVYTFFGILSNSQDQWLWSCQIPFSEVMDRRRKELSLLLLLCFRLQSLLPKLCSAKWPNPPTRSQANERGCFLNNRRIPLHSAGRFPIGTQNQRGQFYLCFLIEIVPALFYGPVRQCLWND